GSEFLHEEALEHLLHIPIYYCHPYSAWEKGSIERHNRLLRTYYPKSTDFAKLTPRALKQIQNLLIHYPRKAS
ncbi:MAG: IS30 family transposase, partial [Candidatus Spyradenecus sp.]